MSSNKKIGSDFEKELCQLLSDSGYWVMVIPDDSNGQPFDIIAGKNNSIYAFECKTCQNGKFDTSRIEVNQRYGCERFLTACNQFCYFVFKYDNKIYIERANKILEAVGIIDISNCTILNRYAL